MIRFKTALALTSLALALVVTPASAATSWDFASDWTISNGNPNGVWTYGYIESGVFTAYNSTCVDGAPDGNTQDTWRHNDNYDEWGNFAKNHGPNDFEAWTSYREAGKTNGGPANGGRQTTAVWTAPTAGDYAIHILITGQSIKAEGTTANTFVYKNNVQTANGKVSGFFGRKSNNYADAYGDAPSYAFDQVMSFGANETVAIGVDYGDDLSQASDNYGIEFTVTAVPEPSSILSLVGLLGTTGFMLRRKTH